MLGLSEATPPQPACSSRRKKKRRRDQKVAEQPLIVLGAASLSLTLLPASDWGESPSALDITAAASLQVHKTRIAATKLLPLATSHFRVAHLANRGARAMWDAILRVAGGLKGAALPLTAPTLVAISEISDMPVLPDSSVPPDLRVPPAPDLPDLPILLVLAVAIPPSEALSAIAPLAGPGSAVTATPVARCYARGPLLLPRPAATPTTRLPTAAATPSGPACSFARHCA